MNTTMKAGSGMTIGAALSAVVVWAWNSYNPDHAMPAELAAPLGAVLGHIIGLVTPQPGT